MAKLILFSIPGPEVMAKIEPEMFSVPNPVMAYIPANGNN